MVNKYKELYDKLKKDVSGNINNNTFTKSVLSYTRVKEDLNNAKEHKVRYRVIYNDIVDDFFVQYEKHFFKLGSTWKGVLCFHKKSGYTCPICDFLENNKKVLDGPFKYRANINFNVLVFNYRSKKLEKLSVNNQEMMNILSMSFDSGIDISENKKDGFDVYYKLNDRGYQEILGVKEPEKTLEELLSVRKDDVELSVATKEVYNDVNPTNTDYFYNSAVGILELLINVNCPDLGDVLVKYEVKKKKNDKKKDVEEDNDEDESTTKNVIFDDDDNDEINKNDDEVEEEEEEEEEKPLNKKSKILSKNISKTSKVVNKESSEDELDLDELDKELGL